jgi:hypothetical protein
MWALDVNTVLADTISLTKRVLGGAERLKRLVFSRTRLLRKQLNIVRKKLLSPIFKMGQSSLRVPTDNGVATVGEQFNRPSLTCPGSVNPPIGKETLIVTILSVNSL